MKLRSNRVFKRGKPKIDSSSRNLGFSSERRLSLRSSKSNYGKMGESEGEIVSCVDSCYENVEISMKEGLNSDDKGLFLGSEVLDPMEDLVVSCPNESMSINLSETGLDSKEEVNRSKSLESEIFADDKETSLNDPGNPNILGKCKDEKKKGRRGRKKKIVGNLKEAESNQEKIDVVVGVSGDDDECTIMPLKRKRGRKRKNVEALGLECNGRAKNEKVDKDGVQVTGKVLQSSCGFGAVILGLRRLDDVPKNMLKHNGKSPKVLFEVENMRPKKKLKRQGIPCKVQGTAPKKKLKREIPCKLQGTAPKKKLKRQGIPCKVQGTTSGGGAVAAVDGEFRVAVVLGLKKSDDISKKMLKRCGRSPKVLTEGENMKPKKKLKGRGRPRKLQGEITPSPLSEIPRGRGRPRKDSHEIPRKGFIFKKFKRRGRPPKMEAKTLATHVIKMRTMKLMSVKESPKICKNENFEGNSEQIGGNLDRKQLKQLIRDKISNVLLKCGWTIDFRRRQEKSYNDAVYIEPNGKRSHWSITAAYAKLKKKIEIGDADNNEMSAFTPIPEEEISILCRQPRKERKKKNNKILKNTKKGKTVTDKKKKLGKKSKDGSKRKMLFKPRVLVRGSENGLKQDNEGVLVIKKRNLLSWMIDSGVILVGAKVEYGKTRKQKRSSEGIVTSDGICCGCCNEIMGITKFVGHCGGKSGQVFDNLYLESGTSLRKCLMDSWRKEEESDVKRFNVVDIQGDDPNDDTCNICGDGGNLICCDGCPSTFHQSCLDVQNFPSGDWNCIYCACKFCGEVSVSTPQAEDSHDEITSQMLSCCLCEEKFHQLCVQEVEDVKKDSNMLPFCGRKCQELFERLQAYLGVKHELEDGFSWTLLQRSDVDQDFNVFDTQLKVEHNSKLAIAFSVMDECFVSIVDERSGTNIIRNVVYNCGSNFKRLNYAGFLTAVLEKDDEFITAASIRIHGYRSAEMPFIGTRHIYRRQGMCRRLLDAIETTLFSLGVEELIIPAIPALLQTWTNVFGFMPLEESQKQAMKCMSMIVFPGIEMLKKPLLHNQSADVDHPSSAGVGKDVIDHDQKEETVSLMDGCSSLDPNDENSPQVETTSSNATDNKQTSVDTADNGKDIIDYQQTERETVLMDCCSCPDLENDKLTISHGVNSLCDLNLPVKDVLPCETDGQTSVDSESFPDCTIEPSSLGSVVCGNPELSESKLDVENDGVLGVKVKPCPMTSKSGLKNTFDLNLHPTAIETDVHIISDDSVQCESQACIKSFELSDLRSRVDQSSGDQTDSKTCESQPLDALTPFCEPKVASDIALESMIMLIYENIEADHKDLHPKYDFRYFSWEQLAGLFFMLTVVF